MPHQDPVNLRTPLESLKSLLELIPENQLQDVQRHGNAIIRANVLAITALVTFGWTRKDSLTERFQMASDAVQRLFPNQTAVFTRQGLFSALRQCGARLLNRIRAVLIARLEQEPCWLLAGRPLLQSMDRSLPYLAPLGICGSLPPLAKRAKGLTRPKRTTRKRPRLKSQYPFASM